MQARVIQGDCLAVLPTLDPESVDAIVCDPPYGLEFMGKAWDSLRGSNAGIQKSGFEKLGKNGTPSFSANRRNQKCPDCSKWAYDHKGRKCECGGWKHAAQLLYSNGFQQFSYEWAVACLRVAKPGAHLVAFGGTRTFHRLACAIEDAGWEIRDTLMWVYGSGFPKSSRVNRDPRFCQCGEPARNGECSSPERPQADHIGTAAASPDGGPLSEGAPRSSRTPSGSPGDCLPGCGSDDALALSVPADDPASARLQGRAPVRTRSVALAGAPAGAPVRSPSPALHTDRPSNPGCSPLTGCGEGAPLDTPESTEALECTPIRSGSGAPDASRSNTASQSSAYGEDAPGFPRCQGCGKPVVDGFGTALKPSWEPIILARKPLAGTVAANVAAHGTGGLNIDTTRIGGGAKKWAEPRGGIWATDSAAKSELVDNPLGRWPANVVLSHSPECREAECSGSCPVALLDAQSGERKTGVCPADSGGGYRGFAPRRNGVPAANGGDTGGASRFFATFKGDSNGDHAGRTGAVDGNGGGARSECAEGCEPLARQDHTILAEPLARFRYCAKASRREREAGLEGMPQRLAPKHNIEGRDPDKPSNYIGAYEGYKPAATANVHPTVKPLALMRWLCRLVTPPGGLILDPFTGSGSTGCAAVLEGFRFLGIEREAEYVAIAERRIAHWASQNDPQTELEVA